MIDCPKQEQILKLLGKPFKKLTEKEWDKLFKHTRNCKICMQNKKEARKLLDQHLRDAIREFILEHGLPELGILPDGKALKRPL